jgi:L-lactate dehydrogenase complex protein LldG
MTTSARDEILGSVRTALKHVTNESTPRVRSKGASSDAVEIRIECERNRAQLIEQFQAEVQRVGARFYRAADEASVIEYIQQVSRDRCAENAIGWNEIPLDRTNLERSLQDVGVKYSTEAYNALFLGSAVSADLGVSAVDYALADTGTLVLLARTGQARSISLLPPVHIAVVKAEQLLSSLDDLFPLLSLESDLASAITFITGPSRTADIELTLVVGVHGPQELHVVLLQR